MKIPYRLLALGGMLLVAACGEDATSVDSPTPSADIRGPAARPIGVLTRNVYVGADVDAVIGALASSDPSDDLPALQAAIATLQATDFPSRARALVGEIARTRPDVVGLQEVSKIHVDLSAIGMPMVIDLDFLAILQAELARRRLPYDVAAVVTNTDATPVPFIRLTDFDVMLINRRTTRVEGSPVARSFAYNIGAVAPGVDIKRGYIVANLVVNGGALTAVSTHLESGSNPQIAQLRAAQAMELATVLGTASPAILLGDLNDTPGSAMTQVLAGAGFTDSWTVLRPRAAGFTCCNQADLSNARPQLDQRIDYVWERGLEHPKAGLLGVALLTGIEPWERVRGPAGLIWASDHAGVFAQFVRRAEGGD